MEQEAKILCDKLVRATKESGWADVSRVDLQIRKFAATLSSQEKKHESVQRLKQAHKLSMASIEKESKMVGSKIETLKENSDGLKAYEQTSSVL
jgi:hypothetical protein